MSEKPLIQCYVCRKLFPRYRESSRFCSEQCRNGTTISSKIKQPVKCVSCENEFVPISSHNKYCSMLCREEYRAKKAKRLLTPKPCSICEKEFMPVVAAHLYCGFECRAEADRRKKQKYRQTEKGKAKVKEYNDSYIRFEDARALKNRNLLDTYGINIEQYEQMVSDQKSLCFICSNPPPGTHPLAVDHCHTSNLVRKLLCIKCNLMLGNCNEDVVILLRAIKYLIDHHPDRYTVISSLKELLGTI